MLNKTIKRHLNDLLTHRRQFHWTSWANWRPN